VLAPHTRFTQMVRERLATLHNSTRARFPSKRGGGILSERARPLADQTPYAIGIAVGMRSPTRCSVRAMLAPSQPRTSQPSPHTPLR